MKNNLIYKSISKIKLKITGKNIERFIKRLTNFDIEILDLKYLKYDEIVNTINKEKLEKIQELKTIYEVEILSYSGFYKYKEMIKKNKMLILSIIISFSFIIFLNNKIYYIDVVHNDENIRNLIKEELSNNNIRIYALKKNYKYIENVKRKIMEKHKDKIEWIEIEQSGTKYIVRLEERKINEKNNINDPRNLVAKKDAVIISVEATNGVIIKNKNDYVKKGDIIVSGTIDLNGELKDTVSATGRVYGEVWYKVIVEYPLDYIEERITGEKKDVYTIKFLNNNISLYNDYFITKEEVLYQNKTIPFSIIKQTKNKILKINQTLTKEEAILKAKEVAIKKINSKLNDNEYIIDSKKLKVEENNSKIILELFVTVCEDITEYSMIEGE